MSKTTELTTERTTSWGTVSGSFSSFHIVPATIDDLKTDSSYLGDTFNIAIAATTCFLSILTVSLNVGIMKYYWPKVKTLVGFIYFILSSSDMATGLCAGLHTLIFTLITCLKNANYASNLIIFILLVPSYFLSVVAFKVSAFVSMIFAVVRSIGIVFPLSSLVRKRAVVIAILTWSTFWAAVALLEMGLFLERAKSGTIEEMKKNVLLSYFYQPNKCKVIQKLFPSTERYDTAKGTSLINQECLNDLVYTAMPVFLCAGITIVASAIQIVSLAHGESGNSDLEGERKKKAKVSITIILIGAAFIVCSSCSLYQPLTVCIKENKGSGEDRRVLYLMGYMPFFLNAALNPLILVCRVASLKEYFQRSISRGTHDEHVQRRTIRTGADAPQKES